jgi:hypothetical protein
MSFANLKRQSGNLEKLATAIQTLNASPESSDNRDNYWKPSVDRAGNGMATIRFLPASESDGDDSLPWVKVFSHGFQGPGGQWLIDNCLTTKNQQCPICEHNSTLWNSGIEANKEVVRKQKRKLSYISNIYVVSDPKNPENEGKVFLFKFGKKIFDKITEAMSPEFADETPINPFDMWKGANFKLKIRKVEGYQNYDKSEFESAAPLLDNDETLEKVWKQEYCLKDLVGDSEFKSFDQLKSRLDKVLGLNGETVSAKTTVEQMKSLPKKPVVDESQVMPEIEDDDLMTYFSKLAEQD